jgi:DNA-binding transcriptional regulator YiaG
MVQRRENTRRECEISLAVDMAQMHMFDIAYRKHGFSRKILASHMEVSVSTVRSWEEGASMPVHAFVKLARVPKFPNELLSLMLEPADRVVADAEEDESDLDDLALSALDVLVQYVAARHPDSPSGIKIDHTERGAIKDAAKAIAGRAKKVAS